MVKSNFDSENVVTLVSGLPRSGTSMMMKILEAGGMEVLTDNLRTADEDNPKGYYEFELVKKMKERQDWLLNAKGKVVKVISALLKDLPPDFSYKVIFMRRNMAEILASQRKMLIRRGEPTDSISDEKMEKVFENHLKQVKEYLKSHDNFKVMYVDYNDVLCDPEPHLDEINAFMGNSLDKDQMRGVVDTRLYRNKA
ncbi:sulfotransferase family protein [candidate division KSB1 bacterium]|nr:sulfotransferase family protein [candidate division KSB1 bacterium]